MSKFANYVTGGAFQLNLSRRQIDVMAFTKLQGQTWIADGYGGYGTERVLMQKGLLEHDPNKQNHDHYHYLRLSQEGELVYRLLEMAGLINKREPAVDLAPVGVSGIGITSIGSHSCGKNCTTEDERE